MPSRHLATTCAASVRGRFATLFDQAGHKTRQIAPLAAERSDFCQWLDERGLLWSFYQRWRDSYERDPTGVEAFEQVVGETPEAANAAWVRWVKQL